MIGREEYGVLRHARQLHRLVFDGDATLNGASMAKFSDCAGRARERAHAKVPRLLLTLLHDTPRRHRIASTESKSAQTESLRTMPRRPCRSGHSNKKQPHRSAQQNSVITSSKPSHQGRKPSLKRCANSTRSKWPRMSI